MKKRILTLFILIAMTLTASATDFITDVMLLGNSSQSSFNSQLNELTAAGWTDINKDLNAGCGSGSDYIHLLYRKQSSSGNTGVPITDFYIRSGNNPPGSLTYGGRTYYLVPCDGSSSFISSQGDLNHNGGGDYIYLYYTKDALTNNHGVTGITFNATQSGAVGENGGSTGYDLNAGCGSNTHIYMHLTTTTGGNVVTLSSGSGEVPLQNGHILTGTGGPNTRVKIASGATVTLSGVNITAIANDEDHEWPGIGCLGNVVIVLGEGTTNTVNGGYRSSGIYVPADLTLTIQGSGTLNTTGDYCAAGIGSGHNHSYCGNIAINGGTVTATGGRLGAGIGSGSFLSSCGNITISGGTVTATGGLDAAGIGSGNNQSSCGNITISGGTITATGGSKAAGIGSGEDESDCGNITITQSVTRVTATKGYECDNAIGAGYNSTCGTVTIGTVETGFITQSPFTTFPYTVAFNANGGTGTMASMPFMYNVAQNLTANAFTNGGLHFLGWATSANGPEVYTDGQSVSNLTQTAGATVTLYAKWTNTVTLTQQTGEVLLLDGNILTGTGGPNTRVKIADGATVTFSGVDITAFANHGDQQWPGIDCLGNAVIVLGEGTTNTINGGYYRSGIYVPVNKTLTIQGNGTLNVHGSDYSAGIGSSYYTSCGNITINGGTVTATGSGNAAGIGGCFHSSCGNITINEGTVNAAGGKWGAGIGSGRDYSSCGNITINGGTVNATGGLLAAGIGSGYSHSSCGNISITQDVTSVTATKGDQCNNAIGAGNNSTCGTVTIGTVETGFITQSPFTTFPYTVAFDANGGTGTMANMPFMYNVAQNLTTNAFTNGGLHFLGWATSANGPEVYTDGQSVSNLTQTGGATVTLYAKWTNTVTLTQETGEVRLQDGDILTGTGGPNTRVIIADGATVTFSGVDITAFANNSDHRWSGICCMGNAVIVLGEGTTNSVKGGYFNSGIYVLANKTLTIQGSGTLIATGGDYSAGIGGGYDQSCGSITINGGTVTATGGFEGAGIGSSYRSSCGSITISGGTVNATGGQYAAGIGSGYYQSSCGNITISGGTVTATGGSRAAGIGSGEDPSSCGNISITQGVTRVTATKGDQCDNAIGSGYNSTCGTVTIGTVETGFITQSPFTTFPYTVAYNANGGTGTMANQVFMYNVAQNLTANAFTNGGLHFLGWATSANGPEVYTDGQSVSNLTQTAGATVTLYAKWTNTVTLTQETGEVLLQDGNILTGTGGPNTRVKIADGATVTFSGVNNTAIANDSDHQWPGIDCLGNAVIVLGEGTTNTVKGGYYSSGIYMPANKTLTIQGSGTLNATGGDQSASIGSGFYQSCGNITISGGIVNATGGEFGASIGSGYHSSCGSITISGGTVNATGGLAAAGIGSGPFFSSCGSITINGGTVTATGGNYGAGVGSGNNQSSCGNITISGGTVTATGGSRAAGIGSGEDQSSCGNISITQDVTRVTATKGNSCDNAIGAGKSNSTCGTVTIGTVETGFITQSPFTTFPYTVAFNANGGTGTMANQVFMYNVAQNLLGNVLYCIGYYWDGWATTLNGPEVYDNEQSVTNLTDTPGSTVTLYARWIAVKPIAGYGTGNGGWKLIASPLANAVTLTEDNGFITNEFDLYRFDQTADLEWENWKQTGNHYHFNLESGRGYLYASQANTTLVFDGTPYSGNGQVTLTKTANVNFSGWNLIGNPYGAEAVLDKPFYRMNAGGTALSAQVEANSIVEAKEGVFVQASANDETVMFTSLSRQGESVPVLNINLTRNRGEAIDNAIIRFDGGQTLGKFTLHKDDSRIYIPQDGEEYAIVNAETTGEIPVNFKASKNGTYTISVDVEGLELGYLHLIDNMTGADVDLLALRQAQGPASYTFQAKTTDYASRFKLVFATNDGPSTGSGTFAFISNGNIIINDGPSTGSGTSTLQIVDVTGRIVVTRGGRIQCVPTSGMTPGVYILRLINGDDVKTQKIVIE